MIKSVLFGFETVLRSHTEITGVSDEDRFSIVVDVVSTDSPVSFPIKQA